ncbi:MAG: hypothetical protein ACI94Y_000669 [Maribacter sp.]|jgi:hypothetical protein
MNIMKSLLFCLVMFVAPFSDDLPDMSGITKALQSGDAVALASFFASDVELAVSGNEDLYAKPEAQKILAKFFSSNKPTSFSQVHKGTSKGKDSHYVIGDLVAGGKTYKIYIYLEEVGDTYEIQELRIE